jgi:hypothetical protein
MGEMADEETLAELSPVSYAPGKLDKSTSSPVEKKTREGSMDLRRCVRRKDVVYCATAYDVRSRPLKLAILT